MESNIRSEEMDFLFEAILQLRSKEECYKFFGDICTINELKSIKQRLQVSKMLIDKRTYLDIANTTGASTATISRVNRSLSYGSGGYEIVFDRMEPKSTQED
ncbi:MAG: YerC/YecD family TrpR-related protein [Clostridium sp.]